MKPEIFSRLRIEITTTEKNAIHGLSAVKKKERDFVVCTRMDIRNLVKEATRCGAILPKSLDVHHGPTLTTGDHTIKYFPEKDEFHEFVTDIAEITRTGDGTIMVFPLPEKKLKEKDLGKLDNEVLAPYMVEAIAKIEEIILELQAQEEAQAQEK